MFRIMAAGGADSAKHVLRSTSTESADRIQSFTVTFKKCVSFKPEFCILSISHGITAPCNCEAEHAAI